MQSRNAARLEKQDHAKIELIKEQLVLIAMLALNGEGMPDFLKYTLLEGKISYDLQKVLLFPQSIPKVKDQQLKAYVSTLRANSDTVCTFIKQSLFEDIKLKSNELREIFKPDLALTLFSSTEQANEMARNLLEQLGKRDTYHTLKSAEYILSSKGIYEDDLVKSFQKRLFGYMLEENKSVDTSDLWTILRLIIKENQSLVDTGKQLLKETLSKVIREEGIERLNYS